MEYNFSSDFSNLEFDADKFQELSKSKHFFYNVLFNNHRPIEWLFLLERFYQKYDVFLGFKFQEAYTVDTLGYLSNDIEIYRSN